MLMKNGHIYEGHFKDGLPDGKCRYITEYISCSGTFTDFTPSGDSLYTFRFPDKDEVLQGYYDDNA
jgi:hypothetical protein